MILPDKSLGQHFLNDNNVLERITGALELNMLDRILEIGPGPGYLTNYIVPLVGELALVEVDYRFHSFLEPISEKFPYTKIFYEDFLKMNLDSICHVNKCTGNLPYNIAMPILEKVTVELNPSRVVFMLPEGTAQRLLAKSGEKSYSAGSIFAQSFYHIRLVCKVSKNLFRPPPKINSYVCLFDRKEVDVKVMIPFNQFVRSLFSYRRKTLYNALKENNYQVENKEMFSFRVESYDANDLLEIYYSLIKNER